MLSTLLFTRPPDIPNDTLIVLATTVGEVDFVERHIFSGIGVPEDACLTHLLTKIQSKLNVKPRGKIISAACASSTAAVSFASNLIASGRKDCVLIVSCDSITEFVFSGFSSLMALSSERAAPFDRDRTGLSLGEAAAYVLVMSEDRALEEDRTPCGEIKGWGLTSDANHMTGPSRFGSGLSLSIELALRTGDVKRSHINSICAHGTGTLYNDAMEMRAFLKVFGEEPLPTYSIKGALGHTMGASGLVEVIVALESLKRGLVPPTVGMKNVDDLASGWVYTEAQPLSDRPITLSTNAGFGGINAALLLKRYTDG